MNIMRIGYLMQNGAPDLSRVSGPQLHVMAVIKGLQKLGHEVRMVATQGGELKCSDNMETWYQPTYSLTRHIWFHLIESVVRRIQYELKMPFWGLFDSLHYADAFVNQLRGFDILYERHGYMGFGGVLAARLLNIPLVLELNGNIIKEIDERGLDISPLQRNIGRWITIQTFRAADRIVAVSNSLKETLIKDYRISEEKISVVLNGVNLDLFTKKYDKKTVLEKHILDDKPTVVFVGSFEPWHGVNLLVSSFSRVLEFHPNVQLILIGDGSGRDKVVEQVSNLGLDNKVKFIGRLPQEQVAAILSVSKIVVAPYPFEYCDIVGTPLKLLEYLASGKGIVASTAPIHEIIEDGVTGLRVSPADEMALAEGIMRLLSDDNLCDSLGHNAALQAKKYSWDNVNKELSQIFLEERKKD